MHLTTVEWFPHIETDFRLADKILALKGRYIPAMGKTHRKASTKRKPEP